MRQNWPERLWLVRHGQSQGNVAATPPTRPARMRSTSTCAMSTCRCPRSASSRPRPPGAGSPHCPAMSGRSSSSSSPYVRAKQTAEIICSEGALAGGPARTHHRRAAARARVRDLRPADDARHPRALPRGSRAPPPARQILSPAARRRELGRRHPAASLDAQHHQPPLLRPARAGRLPPVVVLCFRYILEELDEAQILDIDQQAEILNCGIAAYEFDAGPEGRLRACNSALWNYGAPLEADGAPKTSAPDAMAGTR